MSSWVAFDFCLMKVTYDRGWHEALKWAGSAMIAFSAIVIAFAPMISLHPMSFFGFFAGHIIWSIVGLIKKDGPLIAINAGFIPIDIYAMYIRL